MRQRTDSLKLVNDIVDFFEGALDLLRIVVDGLLALVEQVVASVNRLVLVRVLFSELADEGFRETINPLLNLHSVILGLADLVFDAGRLLLDLLVARDELSDLALRLLSLVGFADGLIILIEQLHVLVDVLDYCLLAHLQRR